MFSPGCAVALLGGSGEYPGSNELTPPLPQGCAFARWDDLHPTTEPTMPALMIRCPKTGTPVDTGIELDQDTFKYLPKIQSFVTCPACGERHPWSKDDAWLRRDEQG
jgi:hypothetical protein